MQRGEIAKSKAPRRWMLVLLVVLLVGGVAIALFWSKHSNAQAAAAFGQTLVAWHTGPELRCEMVRLWPLPADCVFVFARQKGL